MDEIPQIEAKYKRVYRSFESGDKKRSYDVFVRKDKDKTTVSTIQSEKIAEGEEQTLSVFMREEGGKVVLEYWTGFVGDGLKKYQRQYIAEVEYDAGTMLMSEVYDNVLRIYNHTPSVVGISERIVEFAKMQMKKERKMA